MRKLFDKFAIKTANIIGSPPAFMGAIVILIVWAISGPFLNFSDTWQLVINTSTTIITFLTVFLIQETQNRQDRETQLKLDELIRATKSARNRFANLADLDNKQLEDLETQFRNLKEQRARRKK